MDCRFLTGDHLDLTDYRFGIPQQAGCLTVIPITSQRTSDPARLTPAWSELQGKLRCPGLPPLALQVRRSELDSLTHRIELLTGQIGALFFVNDRPVGLEIAPSSAYFAAVWRPLLMGCYGMAALLDKTDEAETAASPEPYAVSSVAGLRSEMFRVRHLRQEQLEASVAAPPRGEFRVEESQRWQNYRVQSLTGPSFAGQYVEEVTTIEVKSPDSGVMPKMLRNLFRKGSLSNEETLRRRIHYVSLFAL